MLPSAMTVMGRLQESGAICKGPHIVCSRHWGLRLVRNLLCLRLPSFPPHPCFGATLVHILVLRPSSRLPLLLNCQPIKVAMTGALEITIVVVINLRWMGDIVVFAIQFPLGNPVLTGLVVMAISVNSSLGFQLFDFGICGRFIVECSDGLDDAMV